MKFLNKLKKIIGRETAEKTIFPTKIDSVVTMEGEDLQRLIQMHVEEALAKERSSKGEGEEQSDKEDVSRKDIYTWCNEDEENLREIFLDKKINAFKDKIGKVGSDTPAEIAGKHFKNIVDGKFDDESDDFSIKQEANEEEKPFEREFANHEEGYFTLEELKEFCRKNKINYKGEYDSFREKHIHTFGHKMPATPFKVYSDWRSYDDLFGRTAKREIVDYDTFKQIVNSYNLKRSSDYTLLRNSIPEGDNLPSNPNTYYRKEWVSWNDVLNNLSKYFTFEELKELMQKHNIKSPGGYQQLRLENNFEMKMPWRPSTYYQRDWKGWNDFLGIGAGKHYGNVYYTFEELKEYVQNNNIKSPKKYFQFRLEGNHEKKMPMRLFDFYRSDWKGWNDFLGIEGGMKTFETPIKGVKKNFIPYDEFKQIVIENRIYKKNDYFVLREIHPLKDRLPQLPQEVYAEYTGWIGFVKGLLIENKEYADYYYKAAENTVLKEKIIDSEKLKIPTIKKDEIALIKEAPKPTVQETNPYRETLVTKYSLNKDGTINVVSKPSISSLLIQQKNEGHLPYEKAREIVRKFKFKNKEQFNDYLFKPAGIPEKPDLVYFHTGWESWDDFLGNI